MTSKKLAPLVVAILMAAPMMVVLPAAVAQDIVPTTGNVPWIAQADHTTTLYLRYATNDFGNSACPSAADGLPGEAPTSRSSTFMSVVPTSVGDFETHECRFSPASADGTPTGATGAAFAFDNDPSSGGIQTGVVHSFNLTGNTSLEYLHVGEVPSGIRLTVTLAAGGRTVSTADIVGDDDKSTFRVTLPLQNRFEVLRNEGLTLTVTGAGGSQLGGLLPDPSSQWTLRDDGIGASRLLVRSPDAVRAATFVRDEDGAVRDLYHPQANDTGTRIEGVFAVRSAFGFFDARSGTTPEFTIFRGDEVVLIGPQRLNTLTGDFSSTLSQAADGRAVWTFPSGHWEYRGSPGGEYLVRVAMSDAQGVGYRGDAVEHKVFLSAQKVTVKLYDDNDPLTTDALESNAHTLAPAGETTFLLLVNNSGAVNDTFDVRTQFISGDPSSGWSAVVGGPGVLDGRVQLGPNEQKLVTVRVTAPQGTTFGDVAIYQVSAVSLLDPTAESSKITLSVQVSNDVTGGVDVIVARTTETLEPATVRTYPVYVWNRGSRAANLTLDLQDPGKEGWSTNLLLGNLGVKSLQIPNVRPGDIARADIRVSGPLSGVNTENRVTLVATNADVGGQTRSLDVVYRLVGSAAVKVEILESVNGVGHFVETHPGGAGVDPTGQLPDVLPNPSCAEENPEAEPCTADGANGVWFRAWITNTGKRADNFTLTLDTLDWARGSCEDSVFASDNDHQVADGKFQVYFRNVDGTLSTIPSVFLDIGKTAEVYVFRSVNPTAGLCADDGTGTDFFSFVLTATGRDTLAQGRAGGRVVAENRESPVTQVLLEPVARERDYSPSKPLVNTTHIGKRIVKGGVQVNDTAVYYVRVTNAASWSWYDTDDGRVRPEIKVHFDGVDVEDGWNVSMREVKPSVVGIEPVYNSTVLLSPPDDRRAAWEDYEIEVRVQSPRAENGTALAGEKDQFTLKATIANRTTALLEIETEIRQFRDIELEVADDDILAHAGEPAASLLVVRNDGSSAANVTLRASMDADRTFNANAWSVEPAEQAFSLEAFKDRSVAILVTPPGNAIQGQQGVVTVSVEYAPDPLEPAKLNRTEIDLVVEVTAQGTLQLEAAQRETTIIPGGFANFTMTLRNTGGIPVQYNLVSSDIPGWNQTLPSTPATIEASGSRQVTFVLEAPMDVTNESRFAAVVNVVEVGNDANFDLVPFHINIRGGQAIASLSAPVLVKTVDRANVQNFEVLVKNVGSKTDVLPLQVRSEDPAWQVSVTNALNQPISSVRLGPNELVPVNVTVRAPFVVPENKLTKVELTAFSPDFSQNAKVTLDALIHDYGVELTAASDRVDAFAGVPAEFILKLRNTGNDNDTLNLSAITTDLQGWVVDFSSEEVRLEKGQEVEVRATAKAPRTPLPSPRAYNFRFYAGTLDGVQVNITKNDTLAATVNVLDYRSLDIDNDGFLEIAVNENKNAGDGFETFREVFPDGAQSVIVARAPLNGKARFFLDVPGETPYDGIADRWFDPESVFSYRIRYNADLNGDASPDYLIDSNRDQKVDLAYDTEGGIYWTAIEIKSFGDDRIQFLVDTNGDGRPDRFFDPETKTVTRIQPQTSTNVLGIDTDNDGRINKYYDTKTGDVSDAKVRNFADFAQDYWYFFVVFAVLALVTIALLVRRFRD